jgi:hypothetical protein
MPRSRSRVERHQQSHPQLRCNLSLKRFQNTSIQKRVSTIKQLYETLMSTKWDLYHLPPQQRSRAISKRIDCDSLFQPIVSRIEWQLMMGSMINLLSTRRWMKLAVKEMNLKHYYSQLWRCKSNS